MSAVKSVRAVSFDAMNTLLRPKEPIGCSLFWKDPIAIDETLT